MRKFNTASPCFPEEHYILPTLVREANEKGDMFALYCPLETL